MTPRDIARDRLAAADQVAPTSALYPSPPLAAVDHLAGHPVLVWGE